MHALASPFHLLVTLLATTANAQALGYAVAGPATTTGFVSHSQITFNAAGGADGWIGDRAGIRFEVRDHLRPDDRGTTHYWTFRIGAVFR